MKSAAPFIALGGGVIAVVVGIFVFGDQLGIGGKKPQPATPVSAVSETKLPDQTANATPAASEEKAEPAEQAEAAAEDGAKDTPVDVASLPKADDTTVETPKEADIPQSVEQEAPEAVEPSFDVVRVEPDGQTLVAGKASPGWKVELKNGAIVLSSAEADANGEWVMVLDRPLEEGVSDLSLNAKSADGSKALESESNVTVALPEGGKGELLVVETKPGEASRVLANVPAPKAEETVVAKLEETKDAVVETAEAVKDEAVDVVEQAAEDVKETVEEAVAAVSEPVQTSVPEAKEEVSEPEATPSEPVEVAKVEEPKAEPQAEPVAPVAPAVVSIEAVEIEGDTLFVAGAAEPSGSLVRLYVDNKSISDSRSGVTGRFLFDGELTLEAGEHQARVDLIDPATGKVATRAEVSFSKKATESVVASTPDAPAEPSDAQGSGNDVASSPSAEPVEAKTRKVIIRRGDNLWEIARRVYGAGIRYSTIYDTNIDQIRDPHWIYPGQVFELPEGQDGWDQNFDAVESPPEEADQSAQLDQPSAQ
ncbi:LysM peptidoglycan-binding domain-containing protein [uncultured Cohaesibacter sp.]|uniref:LysM peptidoglycan-binding domain-containing protein n=1 Tax=uncultured Cohaesibacter sp. TaxID=1002546 RepID=UPI0029C8DAD3|nr:LysM peptidoglycan-binding domain-containing protein [uncultured Cohaesibacter sp.]